ncbi:MAG: CvpA family protein [Rhodoferax sp.]|jgi:membrane protein required for colicin V production|nr:CvpA family protein [Rhodoferax sp.]
MAILDWAFAGILLLSMLVGAWRGLVYEVLSLAGWVAAFVLAQWFAPQLAAHLPMAGADEVVRYAAAFVLVFIGAVFVGSLLTWLVSKLFQAVGLRPADRALGAVFGLLRGVVVLMALCVMVSLSPLKSQRWWQESASAPWVMAAVTGLKPVLPIEFGRHLP